MQLQIVEQALLTVTDQVFHYEKMGDMERYIVWAEDSEGSSVEADNYKIEQSIQGTIDLFSKIENDPWIEEIQKALNKARVSFYLNSVQYEEETGYIHYEWVWEVT
ncbi:MAG: hypothetical protein SOR93_03510 [Clostridiales Family XIII bacterium]|uniref:hypothetical protein n=1 Tax=Hominibacterium faecale TaxID=2839743 RepID=UPI0022B2AAC3|nr:hypothetical protein [Hominibacterium faecale]MCI7301837.1 hypothetical protein [Clostridia bacterium]MDY3010314.1 hypothetical protein [Clostridiales Family XIII bacterium]